MDVDKDTVQRQRQQLQQQWQGTDFSSEQRPQSPGSNFHRAALTFYIQTLWVQWLGYDFCTQLAREHPRCSRTAVSRAQALSEFKLIYWGPAWEGIQTDHNKCRSTFPSSTEPMCS